MLNNDAQFALLKVLAAASWADGRLDFDEMRRIRDLMLHYRLSEEQIREVCVLLEAPVSYARCEELARSLMGLLKTEAERDQARADVETESKILRAGQSVAASELDFLDSVTAIMAKSWTVAEFMSQIVGVFRQASSGQRDKDADPGALTKYLKNTVLQRLQDLSSGEWARDVSAETLNYYTLFGAVLGRVAAADSGICKEEAAAVRFILASKFKIGPPLLDWVVQSVEESSLATLEREELLSEFNRVSDTGQRQQLLDAAFSVATADGKIASEELEELQQITNGLWLEPIDFHKRLFKFRQISRGIM